MRPSCVSTFMSPAFPCTRCAKAFSTISTPVSRKASRTYADISGSSCPNARAASMTVTSHPKRRCACAISIPICPPPMIKRCLGLSGFSNRVSLVRYGTSSSPVMVGSVGEDPVATTNRRARIRCVPTCTSRFETNRAKPWMTFTPNPSNRSTESWGAIVAIDPRTCSIASA